MACRTRKEGEARGEGGVEENVNSAPGEATVVEISPRMQEGDRRSKSPRARAGAPSAVLFALTVGEKYTPATPPVPRAPQVCRAPQPWTLNLEGSESWPSLENSSDKTLNCVLSASVLNPTP